MATIVTRSGKGSPLTHAEVDANFTNLNTDKLELSGGTMTGNLSFGDNVKSVYGAGSDLQIYSDGSSSYIKESGSGNLVLNAGGLRVNSPNNTETLLKADVNGAVQLRYDNSPKLDTTSTGIDVTGTVTADGLTVQGVSTVEGKSSGFGPNAVFETTGTAKLRLDDLSSTAQNRTFITNNYSRSVSGFTADNSSFGVVNIGLQDGFISFDTAASGNSYPSERMRITSAGNVGIGTASPASLIHANNTSGDATIRITSSDTGYAQLFLGDQTSGSQGRLEYFNNNNSMGFYTSGSERMRIDSSGRVGIGTSSPAQKLHVSGGQIQVTNGGTDLYLNSSATNSYVYTSSTPFDIYTAGSQRVRVGSTGNVGIGTSSPSYPLTIHKTGDGIKFEVSDTVDANYRIQVSGSNIITGPSTSSAYTFQTGNTERMRIDSSGNVGIGESSPDGKIDIAVNGANEKIHSVRPAGGSGSPQFGFKFRWGDDGDSPEIGLTHGGSYANAGLYFDTMSGGSKVSAMRIDSSGNVGIGTTSPVSDLHIENAMSAGLRLIGSTTGANTIYLGDTASGSAGYIQYSNNADYMRFASNGTERMRIDSSGNLLVGQTSANSNVAGHGFLSGNTAYHTRAGNTLILNRLTSDGDIVQFRKDGTTVGSIGANGGRVYTAGPSYGAKFGNVSLDPCTSTGSTADNAYDLGGSSVRWKDLYLSGGVYLGGTGAANKLDDYEEGTFTATLKGSTGEPATLITATYAKYTKVGDTVFIEISYENVNTTGYSGNISIDTLPFTSGTGRSVLNVAHYQTSSWGTTDIPIALIGGSTTTVSFLNYRSGTTWQTTTHSAGSGRYLWITGTYKV